MTDSEKSVIVTVTVGAAVDDGVSIETLSDKLCCTGADGGGAAPPFTPSPPTRTD